MTIRKTSPRILKIRQLIFVSALFLLSLVALTLGNGPALSAEGPTNLAANELISRIQRAHIGSVVPARAFDSYRFAGCIYLEQSALPKNSGNLKQSCIREETGVLQPSRAYVSVVVGTTRVTELVDMHEEKGWQITSAVDGSQAKRNVSMLHRVKYDSVVENARHSLLGLLAALNKPDFKLGSGIEVVTREGSLVITWSKGDATNEFFFDQETLLCNKQIRTVPVGTTIFQYSNYRKVSNVLLPHTIVMARGDGTTVATRVIDEWVLAKDWAASSFDPKDLRF